MLLDSGFAEILGTVPCDYWARMEDHLKPQSSNAIPCNIYGDECNALDSSYMVFTWMSECSIAPNDSMFSRHLITIIPAENYAKDGVTRSNQTLQAAMEEIIFSFARLSDPGVRGLSLECVGIKGDWKFHRQIANLERHYNTNRLCHLCLATKSLEVPFTDVDVNATWRGTLNAEPPWATERAPALTMLRGFSSMWLLPDPLHVWYLGVARDIVGSAMLLLVRKKGFWPGSTQEKRMWSATKSFRAWMKAHGRGGLPKRWHFSKSKITMVGGEYAHFKDKGARAGYATQWLFDELNTKDCENDTLRALLWAANFSVGVMANAGLFLTAEEAAQVHHTGEFFTQQYLVLHHAGCSGEYKVWQLRPKLHLLHHMFCFCENKPAGCKNPWKNACWMDEDFLKKLMVVIKGCHKTTACTNTLKRYLLGLEDKFDEITGGAFRALCF